MKNLALTLLALFSLFFSAPAAAHDVDTTEHLIVRSQLMPGGLEVIIANLEHENTLVSLVNLDEDQEVFSDRIRKHNGYSYNINFDRLAYGRYILAVKKGDVVRKQVILKTDTGIFCSDWK